MYLGSSCLLGPSSYMGSYSGLATAEPVQVTGGVIGTHPTRLDLYVHPGDPIDFTVPVLDADGALVDVSTWSATATAALPGGVILHDFAPTVSADGVRVVATEAQTRAWDWAVRAARLNVAIVAPGAAAARLCLGWIRLYRP